MLYGEPWSIRLGLGIAVINKQVSTYHWHGEPNEAAIHPKVTCPLGQRLRPLLNRSPVPHIHLRIHHGEVGDPTLGGSSWRPSKQNVCM